MERGLQSKINRSVERFEGGSLQKAFELMGVGESSRERREDIESSRYTGIWIALHCTLAS